MALQHQDASGAPPVLHRPSTATPAPPHLPPSAPTEAFRKPKSELAPSPSQGVHRPPPRSSPPPISSPSASGGRDKMLHETGAAGATALHLSPGLPRPARTGLGDVGNKTTFRANDYLLVGTHLYRHDLKYNEVGREKSCAPSAGQWNMINKEMINVGTIGNWTCFNFSSLCTEEVKLSMDLTHMFTGTGMVGIDPKPKSKKVFSEKKKSRKMKRRLLNELISCLKTSLGDEKDRESLITCGVRQVLKKIVARLARRLKLRGKMVTSHLSKAINEIFTRLASVVNPKGEHADTAREKACAPSGQTIGIKVNIQFCHLKFPIIPCCDTTAQELALSVLLEHKIKTNDFYLMLSGKLLDGNTRIKDIPLYQEQTIHVCPRLRGGVDDIDTHSSHLCFYERFDVLMDKNKDKLHRIVKIDASMRGAVTKPDAPFLSGTSQRLLHGVLAYVCSDGHIGRQRCWEGRFTLQDILMSEDGHVRIRPTIAPVKYYPEGGAADYERLYDIVLLFVDLKNERYPVHLEHLLFLLRNATEKLRVKPMFVMFVVNHPCLLNFAEKHKLYYLVEHLLNSLSPADEAVVLAWLQRNHRGYDAWSIYAAPTGFNTCYMYKTSAKKMSQYVAGGLRLCFRFARNYLAYPPTTDLALAEEALSYTFHFVLTIVIECLVKKLKAQVPDQNGVLIDNPSVTQLIEILSNPKADAASVRCFWDGGRRAGGISGSKICFLILLSLFLFLVFLLFIWSSWPLGGI